MSEEKRELTPDEMQELAEIRDDIRKIKMALGLDRDFKELKENEQRQKIKNAISFKKKNRMFMKKS